MKGENKGNYQRFGQIVKRQRRKIRCTKFCLGVVCLSAFCLKAQPSGVISVPTAAELRQGAKIEAQSSQADLVEVRDKLYNARLSKLFKSITADVGAVYTNGVLFTWEQKRPIYGAAARSDSLVSAGNFLGANVSGGALVHERPIIGYETISSKHILVLNFRTGVASGEQLTFRAMQVGITNFAETTIELWDCGTPFIPPPPTPEEIAVAKAKKEQSAMLAAAKAYQGQSNAVLWLQPQATNGSASAQGSLGWHYLNGLGCESNRELGIYWLKKAADQGDFEASNNLTHLKP